MDTPNTNKKKKILVTGASGFLGEKLCNSLLNHGYSVRAFVRHSSDLSSLPSPSSSPHFELAFGDITHFLLSFPPSVNATPSSILLLLSSLGFLILPAFSLKAIQLRKSCIRRRFFALGPTDGGFTADENQVHHEKFFCTEYERSKVAADKIALQAASEGVPIVALYPGVIYGPGKLTAGNIVAKMV
ncbi:putative dihydroflavonol 4-reductase, partial [Bienertia sinuspersici]